MRSPARAVGSLLLVWSTAFYTVPFASAASLARQLETIWMPPRVEQTALARDGQHLAFAVRDGRELQILVYEVDGAKRPARLRVDELRRQRQRQTTNGGPPRT